MIVPYFYLIVLYLPVWLFFSVGALLFLMLGRREWTLVALGIVFLLVAIVMLPILPRAVMVSFELLFGS